MPENRLENVGLFVFDRAAARVRGVISAHLKKLSISERHLYILLLIQLEPLSQQSIADVIGVSRNSMVVLIDQLEHLGLVTRQNNPDNRREHMVTLTDKGKKVTTQTKHIVFEVENTCMKSLSATERVQFFGLLSKIACLSLVVAVVTL